jgi:hypothetical protein
MINSNRFPVLCAVLMFAASVPVGAWAEEFTLHKSDGKVFFCTDQGAPAATGKLQSCQCSYGSSSYGLVLSGGFGKSPSTQCKEAYTAAIISNCKSSPADPGAMVVCDCRYGSSSYGEVVSTVTDAATLTAQCRDHYSAASLSNCRVQ